MPPARAAQPWRERVPTRALACGPPADRPRTGLGSRRTRRRAPARPGGRPQTDATHDQSGTRRSAVRRFLSRSGLRYATAFSLTIERRSRRRGKRSRPNATATTAAHRHAHSTDLLLPRLGHPASVRRRPPQRGKRARRPRPSTAELEASRASRVPGCCEHQSSSRTAGGRAAGIGQTGVTTDPSLPGRRDRASRRIQGPQSAAQNLGLALMHVATATVLGCRPQRGSVR